MPEAALTVQADAPRTAGLYPAEARVVSLDQFRGYTVAGMLVVNFLGGFAAVPAVLKHHNKYCSYADTVMPQFFFAVGFAYRLTYLKRRDAVGSAGASSAVLRRCAGLALLGVCLYHLDGRVGSWQDLKALGLSGFLRTAFQRDPFQALVHIAVTSVWVLPVIGASAGARIAFATGSALVHLVLSWAFYFEWVWNRPGIDGGPLGFLTWTIPLLAGSLSYDTVRARGLGAPGRLLAAAALLAGAGYGISCLGTGGTPPFVLPTVPVSIWSMSQRAGSVSYLTFSTGVSLAVFVCFLITCDARPSARQVGLFRTFGRNALAAYVLHGMVSGAVKPYVPKDSPGWYVSLGFLVYFGVSFLFVRSLEKSGVFVRL